MSLINEMKAEISRLSRKEIKKELETVKRVNAKQRELIANLRRDLSALEREVRRVQKAVPEDALPPRKSNADGSQRGWIMGKGVISMRKKLGLNQGQFAELAGVTPQSVARWEKTEGKIPFRGDKIFNRLQEIKTMGKREATKWLAEQDKQQPTKSKPAKTKTTKTKAAKTKAPEAKVGGGAEAAE